MNYTLNEWERDLVENIRDAACKRDAGRFMDADYHLTNAREALRTLEGIEPNTQSSATPNHG